MIYVAAQGTGDRYSSTRVREMMTTQILNLTMDEEEKQTKGTTLYAEPMILLLDTLADGPLHRRTQAQDPSLESLAPR